MKSSQGQIQEVETDSKSNPLQSSKDLRSQRGSHSSKWVILVIYSLCNLAGGFVQVPFASCAPAVAQIYNTSEDIVGLTTEVFIIIYVPLNFPSVWVIDNWGTKFSIVTGMVLTAGGLWLRLVVILQPSFYWILAGQVLGGIGNPFLLNAAAKLASTWFLPKQRALATSIGAVFVQVGNAIAFVAPIYYYQEQEFYIGNQGKGRDVTANYLWMWAILGSAILLPTLIFFRNKPEIPPSASSEMDRAPLCQSIKNLLKSSNFIFMLIGYTLIYGIYSIIGACISFFTNHYGFSTFDTGYLALTFIMAGLVGSTFYSIIVLKTGKYKLVFLICSILLNIGLALCIIFLMGGRDYLVWAYLAFAFTGFNLIPIIPLSYDFGSQIGYPVSEAVVCGTLVIISQLWATAAYFMVISIKEASIPFSLWSLQISTVIGLIFTIFVKQTLKRKDADEKQGLLSDEDFDEIQESP